MLCYYFHPRRELWYRNRTNPHWSQSRAQELYTSVYLPLGQTYWLAYLHTQDRILYFGLSYFSWKLVLFMGPAWKKRFPLSLLIYTLLFDLNETLSLNNLGTYIAFLLNGYVFRVSTTFSSSFNYQTFWTSNFQIYLGMRMNHRIGIPFAIFSLLA